MNILIETSARHIHVSKEDLAKLFGEGHALTVKKELSQPGQFACDEKVTLVGPKGELKVTILGPERPDTQVELSLTDARTIGISVPIRESGVIDGTPGLTLKGPCGEVVIEKGVIAAKRHIHITPDLAEANGLKDKDIVSVKYSGGERSTTFGDVVVRVSPKFAPAMHIDTDEANAAGISGNVEGEIIK